MTNTSIKWCCTPFQNHYAVAGNRGISVIVHRNSNGQPLFILQSRAFNSSEEPGPLHLAVPMSRVTETTMSHCPWCGVPLGKWYRKHVDEMIRPGLKIDDGL